MDWANSVLERRAIAIYNKRISNLFEKVNNIKKTKRADKNIVSSVSRGRWLLLLISVEGNRITIRSTNPEEIFLKILKEVMPEGKIEINGTFNVSFTEKLDRSKKDIFVRKATTAMNVKIETEQEGELSSFRGKMHGVSEKKSLMKFMKKFLETIYSSHGTVEDINIELTNSGRIWINLSHDFASLTGNFDEDDVLKTINSLLKTRVYEIPSYFLVYIEIQEIMDSWRGSRKGELIQEAGTFEMHSEERFEFGSD